MCLEKYCVQIRLDIIIICLGSEYHTLHIIYLEPTVNHSVHHKKLLTRCEGMSRGEEICVLNSLRFDLLGLLLVSVLSGSGDFKATFAMIFLAVEKKDQHMWRYEQLLSTINGAYKEPALTFAT